MARSDTTRQSMVNRPAATAPVAVAQVVAARTIQTKSDLRISSPKDPAEKEAEGTAKKIMRMVAPSVQRFGAAISLMQNGSGSLSRKGEGPATASNSVATEISNQKSAGSPLPAPVRGFMESRFRADFSGVRVHTGPNAASLARRVNAQAFTVGNNVFFGRDQWRPDTSEGKELLAHELTHTIQQGSAVQRKEGPAVSERVNTPEVQRLGISDALNYFADKANLIPGFRMFTIILGVNPINMSRVERSAANILRAAIEMMPGGGLIRMALDNYGVFDRAGAWVEEQIRSLGMTGGVIRDAINRFLDSLSWRDIFNLGGVWTRAKRIFTEPIDRIVSFLGGLVTGIIKLVKDAILRPLAGLASKTRAWDLLKAVLGQDPITGDPVPRTAETLIGGFMKLIGQEEIWQNIQKANAIPRAWAWFQNALNGLMALVRSIPGRFLEAFRSLTLSDIVALPTAFGRIVGVFGSFILDFLSWAGNTVWDLLQIIFAVVAPGVMPYLQRAAAAFRTILQDPIGFVGNLVRAVMLGFRQFSRNILRHLSAALIGWLTGALSGANIYIPRALNLQELIKFVLSVLGLTWQNIRQKLVRAVGETAVGVMETGFEIVVVLVRQGPAAAWEKIKESLSNLRDMVIEQIMEFVKSRIVTAAITRLVSMLSPAGAFIQAIIAIYNTVMFVVERLRQIAQVVRSIIDSIAAIAAGQVAAAANRVEQTMGGLLTLVISFLARLVGLGRVSDAVTNVVNRVRAPIDRALDRVVDWIVQQARRLGRMVSTAARNLVGQLFRRRPFSAGPEAHNTWVAEDGEPNVASAVMPLANRIADWRTRLRTLDQGVQPRARTLLDQAHALRVEIRDKSREVVRAQRQQDEATIRARQPVIEARYTTLVGVLSELFTLFGDVRTARGAAMDSNIARVFNAYDQQVLPLKRGRPVLVTGSPVTIYSQLQALWNQDAGWAYQMAHGVVFQIERVLESARRVGTQQYPQLTGVEVYLPPYRRGNRTVSGTRVDYTVKDRAVVKTEIVDVGVEVKRYGSNWDAQKILREVGKIRRQLRAYIQSNNPKFDVVRLEIGGYAQTSADFQRDLNAAFTVLQREAAQRSIRLELRRL